MQFSFSPFSLPESGTVVLLVDESLSFAGNASGIANKTNGALARAIEAANFKGKKNELLSVLAPEGVDLDRIIVAGLGNTKELTPLDIQTLGGKLCSSLNQKQVETVSIIISGTSNSSFSDSEVAARVAYGIRLRGYTYEKYKTVQKEDEKKPTLENITLLVEGHEQASDLFDTLDKVADGVFLARDVVTAPPNHLHPESYAEICRDELSKVGVKVTILGEKAMEKLGMGSLLGVGQGSIRESKLVVMEWHGGKKNEQPLGFIGKGVTFDTGGISLKPSNGMEDMKYDMGGSAAVVGLMKALAGRKAKVNAIGIVGLVENMPGHNAQRPSDIVTSMSGQTIEVLNTDAEGRLVLADALWYCQDKYNPKFMVNLATLTGAIVISLGNEYAGLFSNNDELSQNLIKAGEKTDEKLWRFPLADAYDKEMDSPIADMKNIGNGRGAGSITAAQFLQRFVNDVPWAHLDIAGTAWTKKNKSTCPKGAVGFGVQLLDQFVADNYEDVA